MDKQTPQRSVSMPNFPMDIDREMQILCDFNACSRTQFLRLALRLFLEYIYRQFPEYKELPLLPPRRNKTKRRRNMLEKEKEQHAAE